MDNDIAHGNSDTQAQRLIIFSSAFIDGQGFLDSDCAVYSFHRAGKLGQHPVAKRLEHTSATGLDLHSDNVVK